MAGAPYEGWGIADPDTGTWGGANVGEFGSHNLVVESFVSTGSTATSVVTVGAPAAPTFRVTHQFAPSPATPNLYAVKVTIQNLTDDTIERVFYRRVMDWDIEPTPFNELVTIAAGDALAVVRTSDNGFSTVNPLEDPGGTAGDLVDSGPNDHGAMFDFAFGPLAPGGALEFYIYFGAAASQDEANGALAAVGAEAYSFGQTFDGGTTGAPNTFIFAFSGVQGTPIFPDPEPDPADPVVDPPVVDPGSTPVSAAVTRSPVTGSLDSDAQLPDTGASLGRDAAPAGLFMLLMGAALVAIGRRGGGLRGSSA